jgi:hypothetical protein
MVIRDISKDINSFSRLNPITKCRRVDLAKHGQAPIWIPGVQALSGRLRHHLNQEDSGHYGKTWKMVEEQLLINGHRFDGMNAMAGLKPNDSV